MDLALPKGVYSVNVGIGDRAVPVCTQNIFKQWIRFFFLFVILFLGFGVALGDTGIQNLSRPFFHSIRVPHTVLAVAQSHKITFPRTISPPVPFTVTTRLALPEGIAIGDLNREELTAKATLFGPGLVKPLELSTVWPQPFSLPTLAVSGTYHLTDFRLYRGNQLVARALDEGVLEVFENLLITEVTTRPLTLTEIVDRGIVIDSSSFATMDFTAALAFVSQNVNIEAAPIVGPNFLFDEETNAPPKLSEDDPLKEVNFNIPIPAPPEIPNLFIAPIEFNTVVDGDETVPARPPLSGLVVIPGQIGFLHQFFEAQLIVFQNAPQGTPLVVRDLQAKILLPAGLDKTSGTDDLPGDDPLRIARQKNKETTRILPVLRAGANTNSLSPQERGIANFLIEGLTEGTYDMQFEITGLLEGLPGGPVAVFAKAHGSVLIRNPSFTITLSHPKTVRSGEDYTVYAVVTNTGEAVANLVSVKLNRNSVSGATLLSDETQTADTIDPGSSATLPFRMRSRITGGVTATTFPTEDGLVGRFSLRTGVGDLGIPLSPDTLVLPSISSNIIDTSTIFS